MSVKQLEDRKKSLITDLVILNVKAEVLKTSKAARAVVEATNIRIVTCAIIKTFATRNTLYNDKNKYLISCSQVVSRHEALKPVFH